MINWLSFIDNWANEFQLKNLDFKIITNLYIDLKLLCLDL